MAATLYVGMRPFGVLRVFTIKCAQFFSTATIIECASKLAPYTSLIVWKIQEIMKTCFEIPCVFLNLLLPCD